MAQNDYRWGLTVDCLAHSASKAGAHYSKNWDKAKQKEYNHWYYINKIKKGASDAANTTKQAAIDVASRTEDFAKAAAPVAKKAGGVVAKAAKNLVMSDWKVRAVSKLIGDVADGVKNESIYGMKNNKKASETKATSNNSKKTTTIVTPSGKVWTNEPVEVKPTKIDRATYDAVKSKMR